MDTILIVDDNAKWRASLALNFAQQGYATCHAANRREALAARGGLLRPPATRRKRIPG